LIKIPSPQELERPFNLLSWGHWFTFANIILALVFSFFYLSAQLLPETFLGWLYLGVSWLGHFSFLAISCFILTIFPIIALFPHRHHIRGVSSVMATFFQLLLFLDVLTYRGLGYHLSSVSIDQLKEVEDVYLSYMGNGYWVMLVVVFVLILIYQFFVSNLTWKRIKQLQAIKYKKHLGSSLLVAFLSSHLLHMWADATIEPDISKQNNLYPFSYPLTARSILAKYDFIDLQAHRVTLSNQAKVRQSLYEIKPTEPLMCDITNSPNLQIQFIEISEYQHVLDFLNKYNIRYQRNKHLNITSDLNTSTFNFTSGLPGLFQYLSTVEQTDLNHLFGLRKISVNIQVGEYDASSLKELTNNLRVFVFYDKSTHELFYRTKTVLVGFDDFDEVNISPQNIIASYINDVLKCPSFVEKNLIDKPIKDIDGDYIHVNFHDDYLNILYKDKMMLFRQGELVSNQAFSISKPVHEALDIIVIQNAIKKLTDKRLKLRDR